MGLPADPDVEQATKNLYPLPLGRLVLQVLSARHKPLNTHHIIVCVEDFLHANEESHPHPHHSCFKSILKIVCQNSLTKNTVYLQHPMHSPLGKSFLLSMNPVDIDGENTMTPTCALYCVIKFLHHGETLLCSRLQCLLSHCDVGNFRDLSATPRGIAFVAPSSGSQSENGKATKRCLLCKQAANLTVRMRQQIVADFTTNPTTINELFLFYSFTLSLISCNKSVLYQAAK